MIGVYRSIVSVSFLKWDRMGASSVSKEKEPVEKVMMRGNDCWVQ